MEYNFCIAIKKRIIKNSKNNQLQKKSYISILDTAIDNLSQNLCSNRAWGQNNNPKLTIVKFLKINKNFVADYNIDIKHQLQIPQAVSL